MELVGYGFPVQCAEMMATGKENKHIYNVLDIFEVSNQCLNFQICIVEIAE